MKSSHMFKTWRYWVRLSAGILYCLANSCYRCIFVYILRDTNPQTELNLLLLRNHSYIVVLSFFLFCLYRVTFRAISGQGSYFYRWVNLIFSLLLFFKINIVLFLCKKSNNQESQRINMQNKQMNWHIIYSDEILLLCRWTVL